MIRWLLIIISFGFINDVSAQRKFDSSLVDKALMNYSGKSESIAVSDDVIKTIITVDKSFRRIVDSIYSFSSLNKTVLQSVLIKIDDTIHLNPLDIVNGIQLTNIIFYTPDVNYKIRHIEKRLKSGERARFYNYLSENVDYFHLETKTIAEKAVRIIYIKFPDKRFVSVGMDIYGAHFLLRIDREYDWTVVRIRKLWVY